MCLAGILGGISPSAKLGTVQAQAGGPSFLSIMALVCYHSKEVSGLM